MVPQGGIAFAAMGSGERKRASILSMRIRRRTQATCARQEPATYWGTKYIDS